MKEIYSKGSKSYTDLGSIFQKNNIFVITIKLRIFIPKQEKMEFENLVTHIPLKLNLVDYAVIAFSFVT